MAHTRSQNWPAYQSESYDSISDLSSQISEEVSKEGEHQLS